MKSKRIVKFINQLYNGNGTFNFSPRNRVTNIYSTCFAIMALDLINKLADYPLEEKKKMINYLHKSQDPESGLFIDKNCIPSENSSHNLEYINLQITDFAQMALVTLGSKPRYKYLFLKKYKNKKYLEEWLEKLNWKNPWLVSNLIMFLLNSFIYEQEIFKVNNRAYINFIINWLTSNQDQKKGYWNLGKKATIHNQMAGAYHFLFFYTYLNKKPKLIPKIIDSTLSIQDYDGLFNYAGGGGSCDDLDAIDILCRSTFYTDYKREQIVKSLRRAYISIIKNQNKDGGFCWAKRNTLSFKKILFMFNFKTLINNGIKEFLINFAFKLKNQVYIIFLKRLTWKYSGLNSMEVELNESDIWSTWFRLLSLALIETTFPEISEDKKTFDWKMRTKCGLGFYKR